MKTSHTDSHCSPSQGRFPEFFEESLEIDDVVFEFDRIMEEIRIERYLKPAEISFLGRPGYKMEYIRREDNVDLQHLYIDGSKFKANANRYSFVWKKGTEKQRYKLFSKITPFSRRRTRR